MAAGRCLLPGVALALGFLSTGAAGVAQDPGAGADDPAAEPRSYPYEVVPVDAIRGHLMEGQFKEVTGVGWDAHAREILVTDSKNALIGIFDPRGVPLFTFGGRALLVDPKDVAVGPEGTLYVLDSEASALKVFSYRGEPRPSLSFTYPEDGDHPAGEARVGAFALAPDGGFVVGDLNLPQVLVYGPDLALRHVIRHGEGGADFAVISGIAVAPDGAVAVVDMKARPVQVFDAAGRFLSAFGTRELGAENFTAPIGVAFDEEGFLYVVDMLRHDVKVFERDGRFLYRFGSWFSPESGGRGPGEMLYPTDLAIGDEGLLFVAERFGNRLQIFRREKRDPRESGSGLRIPRIPRVTPGDGDG